MKITRIYQPGHYEPGETVELSSTAGQHVGVVLRMQPGDPVTLFCGDNRAFSARITTIHKKKVSVSIDQVIDLSLESPCRIHLAQALSKGERMEFVIQKAVELGVFEITPLITDRCVVRLDAERLAKKQSQWQSIAIAACEQSGRNYVPLIHTPCTLTDHLQQTKAPIKLILHPHATQSWQDLTTQKGDIDLIIGPEGGLTDEEITLAIASDYHALRIGPRILRTETAAIAALSLLQATLGDLF